jgi:Fe-S oxidoreductase
MTLTASDPAVKSAAVTDAFFDSLLQVQDGEQLKLCLQCGNCSGACPFGYLMDFPPGRMIAYLRAGLFDKVLDSDSVWMCVSCYACAQACPSNIPITDGLMTRSKEELLLSGNVPNELQNALEKSQRYGNPLGESPRKRAAWARDLHPEVPLMRKINRPVDVLWFVGDYGSYHPRVQLATKAFYRILNALNIDYGILGPEETTDGDSQRLAGERGLFEMLAEKNGQAFGKYEFGEIITTDPHAYNALKNEYPKLGISFPVRHYTEFLVERLEDLKPLLKNPVEKTISFHDPCFLGRANGIYEQPRQLIGAIPGVKFVEMSHNRTTSLCCGGGGGGMWLDGFQWEKAHVRLSEWRVREAVATGAEVLAVACPYESPRFEDAAKMMEGAEDLRVKDITELLVDSMDV